MTTRVEGGTTPKKPRPRWRTIMWLVLATAAFVFCALSVLAKFTWASDEMHWFTAFWAAVGTVGFSGTALRLWRDGLRG